MPTTKKTPLKFKSIETYVVASREKLPDGWKLYLHGVDDKPENPVLEKALAEAYSYSTEDYYLGIVIAYNVEEYAYLALKFEKQFGFGNGPEEKGGWKVVTILREEDGTEDVREELIGKGAWAEKFNSALQIRQQLPKRYLTKWDGDERVPNGKKLVRMTIRPVLKGTVCFYGTTGFKTEKGYYSTFDRIGVEDSFYGSDCKYPLIHELINEQFERIVKKRELLARVTTIPGLGWSVTPERKEAISQKLKAGKSETFLPSGFGTGKTISTRKTRGSVPALAETAAFFGVDKLYVTRFDHD